MSGIPIRIHFTFLLFLAWVAFTSTAGLWWVALIVAVFACVLLHELGHALVARRYSIMTRDITLYPIGGVAMLDARPAPKPEFWISLAGPAVNLMIAAILACFMALTGQIQGLNLGTATSSGISYLLTANVTLAVFNLIPAFPMDGGRVLRSVLAMRIGETKATQIATAVGQGLAVGIGLVALIAFQHPVLMLVAFFVFLGASQEAAQSTTRSYLSGHPLRDAMQVRYRTISHGESLKTATDMLLAGSQHDFPVVAGDDVVGVLTQDHIAQGLATEGPDAYVATYMQREFKTAHPNVPLELAIDMFQSQDTTPILVMEDEKLVGMVTQENLGEYVMVQHALQQAPMRASYAYRA